ncbi:hypothetical protein RFI_24449, partial [Reticulomyxa filosa]
DLLETLTLETFMQIVRKVKPDTVLTDEELAQMFEEWKLCMKRQDFKFTDLHELDFLLYHLGLVVSRGLLPKLSASHLSTLDEDLEVDLTVSNANTTFITSPNPVKASFTTPSFMEKDIGIMVGSPFFFYISLQFHVLSKTEASATAATTSHNFSEANVPKEGNPTNSQSPPILFTIADLVGEFIDEYDNIIRISDINESFTPPASILHVGSSPTFSLLTSDLHTNTNAKRKANKNPNARKKKTTQEGVPSTSVLQKGKKDVAPVITSSKKAITSTSTASTATSTITAVATATVPTTTPAAPSTTTTVVSTNITTTTAGTTVATATTTTTTTAGATDTNTGNGTATVNGSRESLTLTQMQTLQKKKRKPAKSVYRNWSRERQLCLQF